MPLDTRVGGTTGTSSGRGGGRKGSGRGGGSRSESSNPFASGASGTGASDNGLDFLQLTDAPLDEGYSPPTVDLLGLTPYEQGANQTSAMAESYLNPQQTPSDRQLAYEQLREMSAPAQLADVQQEKRNTAAPWKLNKGSTGGRTFEMTEEQYAALTPQQKAAVQFNAMLAQARQKDLRLQKYYDKHATGEESSTYDKTVEDMFGESGGSEVYAPETVALLQQIGYRPTEGEDLDAFLQMKAGFTMKEVKGLADPVGPVDRGASRLMEAVTGDVQPGRTTQDSAEDRIITGVGNLQEELAKSGQMIQTMRASVLKNRNAYTDMLGGKVSQINPGLGWGNTPEDEIVRSAYEAFADQGQQKNLEEIWAALNHKVSPEVREGFFHYADVRSRAAATAGNPLGDFSEKVNYRTPEQFRKLLDLDKGM